MSRRRAYIELGEIPTLKEAYEEKTFAPRNIKRAAKFPRKYNYNEDFNKKISLIQADITKLKIDAIVNAANETLLGGGGVDGAIHRAAGPELRNECWDLNGCETGDAKITKGYDLPSKHVIHTVGPIGEKPGLLRSAYERSMEVMCENSLKSIAFSNISTGVYGYPRFNAGQVALNTTREWLEKNLDYFEKLDRIIFCVFEDENKDVYEMLFPVFFPPPPEIDVRETDEEPDKPKPSGVKKGNENEDVDKVKEERQETTLTTEQGNDKEHTESAVHQVEKDKEKVEEKVEEKDKEKAEDNAEENTEDKTHNTVVPDTRDSVTLDAANETHGTVISDLAPKQENDAEKSKTESQNNPSTDAAMMRTDKNGEIKGVNINDAQAVPDVVTDPANTNNEQENEKFENMDVDETTEPAKTNNEQDEEASENMDVDETTEPAKTSNEQQDEENVEKMDVDVNTDLDKTNNEQNDVVDVIKAEQDVTTDPTKPNENVKGEENAKVSQAGSDETTDAAKMGEKNGEDLANQQENSDQCEPSQETNSDVGATSKNEDDQEEPPKDVHKAEQTDESTSIKDNENSSKI